MGAAGGVRTRGAARGWSGAVETVLGECWDGLGARSIEQQGRVGLGRAGPGRSVPGGGCRRTWLGPGGAGGTLPGSATPGPGRAALRLGHTDGSGRELRERGRKGKGEPCALCPRSVRVFASPGWKKK